MRTLKSLGRLAIVLALALSFLGAAVVTTAPAARADHNTIPWGTPLTVASSTNFQYGNSWVVTDGHGNTYVFYYALNTITVTSNLNVTKYAAVGPLGSPQRLFDEQVNDVSNVAADGLPPAAAVDPTTGNIYVAWDRVPVSAGAPSTVYVSTSTDGGVTWDSARLASAPTAGGSNQWPNVAVAPDGTVWVSWMQNWGGESSVTISKSSDHGLTFGGWTNVTTSTGTTTSSLAIDGHGRLYVAYANFIGGDFINVTMSDNGVTWSPPETLNDPVGLTLFPALFADASGYVHAAWYALVAGNYQIDYSRSADRGSTWSVAMPITASFPGGYIGYFTGEGDTVMFAFGSDAGAGFGFVISADHGLTWYPDEFETTGRTYLTTVAADQNGTFWAATLNLAGAQILLPWYGPPSKPVIQSVVASGSTGLTIRWTPSPEQNVVDYRIWRSTDGTNFQPIALVGAGVTSFTDSGLANGTYYYVVTAVNDYGISSHESASFSGTVGVTIAQLQQEIANLQNQIAALKNTANANNQTLAQLENELTNLQSQLNTLQGQQATQTMSYATLAFEIIVVVLLVVLLLNQMRKPKNPTLMMAQPGQAAQAPPKPPEDEL